MSRQRILQIFNRYQQYGGEEGSVTRIGDALQGAFDIEYFLGSSAELMRPGIFNKLSLPSRLIYNLEVRKRLSRFQKLGRFDFWLVHNVFPGMSPSVYPFAETLGIPVIQYLHNYRFSCVNGFFLNHGKPCQRCIQGNFYSAFATACWHDSALHSGMMGFVLKTVRWQDVFSKIARFIAISHRQKALHLAMGIPEEKIDVIPHFLDAPLPFSAPCPTGHALFIGRLSLEKGGMQLLQAWQKLRTTDRKLVIVGIGPEQKPMEEYCQKNNLRNVVFAGFLKPEEQKQIWDETAFTIVPSIWEESFGMVVLEAWSHQKPVVAHRIGALPELVADGETGLLADADAPEQLAAAMDRFFTNPQLTIDCGVAGYHTLIAEYGRERWLGRIKESFARLPKTHSAL